MDAYADAQRSPLVLIPQHFGSLLYARETTRYLRFGRLATEWLERLRERPAGQWWASAAMEDRESLASFFDHLEQLGLLDVNGRLPAARLCLDPPPDCLAGPLAVHVEVIGACDLSCRHCFAGPLPRNHQPLQLSELETLFDDLASIGSYRLGVTGGEPTQRADLFDVLDAAVERGLAPCVTTNGMRLDWEMAAKFAQRPQVRLHVSLDGATANSNDQVRGQGVFSEVTSRLRGLRGQLRYTLAFTLTRHSVHETEACVKLADRLGARDVVFRPLYPAGQAAVSSRTPSQAGAERSLMPTYEQYVGGLHTVAASAAAGQVSSRGPESCGAGRTAASISAQGLVNPCSFLGPDFDGESIRERRFPEIWRDSAPLRELRRGCGAACGEGQDSGFSGGCRARALQLHGDAAETDPWHDAYLSSSKSSHLAHHPLLQWEVRGERE